MRKLAFGIDFDGTVVGFKYPYIGPEVPNAVRVLKRILRAGHEIYLNTRRGGDYLVEALQWMDAQGIELAGWNDSDQHPNNSTYGSSKIPADVYIDDAALGTPLIHEPGKKSYVDWLKIEEMLENLSYI